MFSKSYHVLLVIVIIIVYLSCFLHVFRRNTVENREVDRFLN